MARGDDPRSLESRAPSSTRGLDPDVAWEAGTCLDRHLPEARAASTARGVACPERGVATLARLTRRVLPFVPPPLRFARTADAERRVRQALTFAIAADPALPASAALMHSHGPRYHGAPLAIRRAARGTRC